MDYNINDVKLTIVVNDRIIEEMPMKKFDVDGHIYRHYIQLKNYAIPCKENDTVKIQITAKDDNNLNYRVNMAAWIAHHQGNYDSPEFNGFDVEVY